MLRLLVMFIAVVVTGYGHYELIPKSLGGRTIHESFNGSCSRWPREDDVHLKLGCVRGEYQILIRNVSTIQFVTIRVPSFTGAQLKVDSRLIGGKGHTSFGLGCWRTLHHGYILGIQPENGGSAAILSYDVVTSHANVVALRVKHGLNLPFRSRLRASCLEQNGKTRLELTVGKTRISATDVHGSPFAHIGFAIVGGQRGSDVHFDNLTAALR